MKKRRRLQDVMGTYSLPLLAEGREVLEFEIGQAAYFTDKMYQHESQFQKRFEADDEKGASKQRLRYIYNFAAYLNSARVFVYLLKAVLRRSPAGSTWAGERVRTQPFRAFEIMRDANTHRGPLHYSLTYQVEANFSVPMYGIVPSHLNVDVTPHLEVAGAPCMTIDIGNIQVSRAGDLRELTIYIRADTRRNSLTYMCSEFLEDMKAAEAESRGFLDESKRTN